MKYELTDAQYERLMDASKPVAMIALQCGTPSSPRENANRVWQEVAREHGVRFDTIGPCYGLGPKFFDALPL